MKMYAAILAVCFISQSGMAEERKRLVGLPQTSDGLSWVEVSIPVAKNGGFPNRIDDQKTEAIGWLGLGAGFSPFSKKLQDDDQFLEKLAKSVGFDVNATFLNSNPGFDDYLYTLVYPAEVTDSNSYQCYNVGGQWNNACYPCYMSMSGYCYDAEENVYGRDTYVKYSDGSVAFGAYIPLSIASKISIQGGANVRFHFVKEGIQTDGLRNTVQTSVGAVLKVGYNVSKKWTVGVAAERSFFGFKYRSYSVFASFKW
jgi:hypothetical protein